MTTVTAEHMKSIEIFTFHNQEGVVNKTHWIHWSSLTEVCCFVVFADISNAKKMTALSLFDTKTWVFELLTEC